MSPAVPTATARVATVGTDERVVLAVLGSVVIVAALAISGLWRG